MRTSFIRRYSIVLAAVGLVGACQESSGTVDVAGPVDAGPVDAGPADTGPVDTGPAPCNGPPGLYVDPDCKVLASDLRPYAPRYTLWADGAEKERYIRLPEGGRIDGSDPDNWIFPVGTTLFKTFLERGVRLETRVLEKVAPGKGVDVWSMKVYAWNAAQTTVIDVTSDDGCPECAALRQNVLGTNHDIPDGTMCRQCHRGSIDTVNGFSAVQLNYDGAGVSLRELVEQGRLSDAGTILTDAVIPGDETARDALGYLHANCGHCHRYDTFKGPSTCQTSGCLSGLLAWVPVGTKAVEDTPLYRTAVGRRALFPGFAPEVTCRISAGHPDASVLVRRMKERNGPAAMPRIATEVVHREGVAQIERFIESMPAGPTECDYAK